jgi:transcriptional regulator with XRE-family HTH domain
MYLSGSFFENVGTMSFVDRFKDYCLSKGITPYKAAQSVGEDLNLVSNWINKKRTPTTDRMMTLLRNFAQVEQLEIDFPTLALWWSEDYLPPESYEIKVNELLNTIKASDPERYARLKPEIERKKVELREGEKG